MNKDAVLAIVDTAFKNELALSYMDFDEYKEKYGDTPIGEVPVHVDIVDIMVNIEDELEVNLPADDEDTLLLLSFNELREKVWEWLQ